MIIASIDDGQSFSLHTKVVPGTTFEFVCSVTPDGGITRVTQGVRVFGPLSWLFGPLIGPRIAAGFQSLVVELAATPSRLSCAARPLSKEEGTDNTRHVVAGWQIRSRSDRGSSPYRMSESPSRRLSGRSGASPI